MDKELLKRTLSGVGFAAAVFVSIWFGPVGFIILLGIIMFAGLYEFSKMALSDELERYGAMYPLALSVYLYGISEHFGFNSFIFKIFIILISFVVFIYELKRENPNPYKNLGNLFLSIMYIAIPLTLATNVPYFRGAFHKEIIYSIFLMIWANDSFAYLIGKNLGKNKLYERISPKKTIEGFAGGLIFTYLMGYVLSLYFDIFNLMEWMVLASIVGIFGVIGDLIESMFKRKVLVKDSGKIMPGHGGILDRLDSFLFTSPFIYIFVEILQM
jgi:phosphatidate cytidylyltransferase